MNQSTHLGLLEGQTVLITGAGNGIGAAIAKTFAAEGANLILTDINQEGCESTLASLSHNKSNSRYIQADLSNKTEQQRLIDAIEGDLVTCFVHCASPRRFEKDVVDTVSEETWDEMLAVNVSAGFLIARHISRKLIEKNKPGNIVFTTSLHAETPRNLPHYSASKAAQTMVVKELAKSLGRHGIRVNAIAPGAIPGGGFNAAASGIERLEACTSLGRLGTPEDIANVALALVCDRFFGYVTGATIPVDGGLALHNWIEPPAV